MSKEKLLADLVKLLNLKNERLTHLLTLAQQASEQIDQDDMVALHATMDACEEEDGQLDELLAMIEKMEGSLLYCHRYQEVIQKEKESSYILRQIKKAYCECNETLHRKLKECENQIRSIECSKKGLAGYKRKRFDGTALFIDAKR